MENKKLFTEMNSLVDEVRYDNKPILEQYISASVSRLNTCTINCDISI